MIDDNLTLYKVEIERECEVLCRTYLNEKKIIREALETKVRNKHVRIGISDRCISIFGKTYSYLTGQSWDFVFQGTETVRNNENSVIQLFNMPFSHLQIAQL